MALANTAARRLRSGFTGEDASLSSSGMNLLAELLIGYSKLQ
jgi:hypothetical protein